MRIYSQEAQLVLKQLALRSAIPVTIDQLTLTDATPYTVRHKIKCHSIFIHNFDKLMLTDF